MSFLYYNDEKSKFRKGERDEKNAENFMDSAGIFMLRTWINRDCTSNSSDRPILYGNRVLFCKKFRDIASLVYPNKSI